MKSLFNFMNKNRTPLAVRVKWAWNQMRFSGDSGTDSGRMRWKGNLLTPIFSPNPKLTTYNASLGVGGAIREARPYFLAEPRFG